MVYHYFRLLWRNRRVRYAFMVVGIFALTILFKSGRVSDMHLGASTKASVQREKWLKDANFIPTKEYNDLLNKRFSRPSPWSGYTGPRWQASFKQHKELNGVIRKMLSNGKDELNAENKQTQTRRNRVAIAAKQAWDAYKRDAFGWDEHSPLSHSGSNLTTQGIGYFIADVLDTLWLVGLMDEYKEGRDYLANRVTFDQPGAVSLFEATIRVLGGLLSAYHLSGERDSELLRLADELGSRLSKSFNTQSGIPPETAILRLNQQPYVYESSTAEITTLQLEFRYLAKLTGNYTYKKNVDNIMGIIFKAQKWDGLAAVYFNAQSARFTGDVARLGSRGDSYYEYLLKQWIQTKQTEPVFRKEYDVAMEGVKRYLVTVSPNQHFTYVGELLGLPSSKPVFSPKMDHLVCFLGGNLALGATKGASLAEIAPLTLTARDREDLILARELTETCVHMYFDTASGLAPEITHFRHLNLETGVENAFDNSTQLVKPDGDILVSIGDRHSLLRPETVESLFILWRITGEDKWREYGWRIFESFERWAKLQQGGFAMLQDVTVVPPVHGDKMETFFVSETLKYLYLLFSDSNTVPLTRYVFNTEAHPLPLFTWN
ncbi:mannosyl-oligosaccharide alpha-1,2-mannosidase [Coemansia spiralis]|uniref:alpha-1,2-Mannosidase n=2 Tax=Coemansia TaxID=4863 RepID=A0A9W8G541_9FUNG|nr:mannosyl-oligosaccharide alpha-1,2-mannosidase [Coemansia umbellata]KAJ2678965.1 mannosyl-oligosaccharide alpha-1,2-mannosidase [Coemansia spiralis]